MKEAIKKAFPITIPIMLGYVPLGIGFGLIMANAGYNALWAMLSSLTIYSGTGQYMTASFLAHGAGFFEIILIIVIMNSRMMFYGLSFLERWNDMGLKKWYMVFSLTDETYAILSTIKAPAGVDEKKFMFCIAMLNQSYWVIGGIIGALFGAIITIDITGIDFIMTALFVVLCMDQWAKYKTHIPFWIGLVCSLIMLVIFGAGNFMIPALLGIVIVLICSRKHIESKQNQAEAAGENPAAAAEARTDITESAGENPAAADTEEEGKSNE